MQREEIAADRRSGRGAWGTVVPGIHVVLLGCCVLLVVGVSLTGERTTSFDQLQEDVAAGKVEKVVVAGGDHRGDGPGYSSVELRWRSGLVRHDTTVTEATSRRELRGSGIDRTQALVGERVEDRLATLDPELRFVPGEWRSSHGNFWSWKVPVWMTFAFLALWLATIALLAPARSPWRATHAAWAWLVVLAPPVGVPAYLLLGGPTGLVPPPRSSGHRLTGGWGFLLACVLAAVLANP